MPRSDNDGGYYIEPTNIQERGNPMADGRAWKALQEARQIAVGDHNVRIRERGLKKYRGVSRKGSKWTARISNRSHDRKNNRVHLGTFPTAEMAAIAFDTSTLLLRGDSSLCRLNFPKYASHIKNILKGCSSSLSNANIRSVASKAAYQLGQVMRPENNDRGLELASSLINLEAQKHQGLGITIQHRGHQGMEFSTPIPAATSNASSVQLISSSTGSNGDYPLLMSP